MERFKYFFFQLLPVDNNSPVAGYLPSVRDSLEDYSEAEKDELIRELLDRNDEMAEENRRLEEKSYTDSMTGLRDSGAFYDSLRENVSRANRGEDFSLMMIDMNDFKGINDNYGHSKGDKLLKRIAQIIQNSCRQEDLVARIGVDEFVVLLPQTPKKETEVQAIAGATISSDSMTEIIEEGLDIVTSAYGGGN
mgnify:CR=1 FL=1